MQVLVYNQQSEYPVNKILVQQQTKALLRQEKIDCDEVHLYYITSSESACLHQKFFRDPSATDCISFPIDLPGERQDGKCILGEIFICPETAALYAEKHHIPFAEELTLYLIHGLLHLLGYDDIAAADKARMRKKEKSCMDLLKNL